MLRSMRDLLRHSVESSDGRTFAASDFQFDPRNGSIRRFVVCVGGWLDPEHVVIAPSAVREADGWRGTIVVDLGGDDLEPSDVHPLQRASHSTQGGRDPSDAGPSDRGDSSADARVPPEEDSSSGRSRPPDAEGATNGGSDDEGTLRSVDEVLGYEVLAEDGRTGSLDDVICDDDTWKVRSLVVNTGLPLLGRKVLVPLDWVDAFETGRSRVVVHARKADIESRPAFDPGEPVNVESGAAGGENPVFDYYGRPKQWLVKKRGD